MPEIDTVLERFEADASQAIAETKKYSAAYEDLEAASDHASKQMSSHAGAISLIGRNFDVAKEFADSFRQGMHGVIEEELAAGRITPQVAEQLRQLATSMDGSAKANERHTVRTAEWKREASRTREAAQFLTSSLGQLASASPAAAAGMRLLAATALGGGGLILALEGLRFGVDLATAAYSEHEKQAKEAQKAAEEHAHALATIRGNLSDFLQTLRGVPAMYVELSREMRKFDQEADPHVKKLDELHAEMAKLQQQMQAPDLSDLVAAHAVATADEIARVQREIDKIDEKRSAARNRADIERAAQEEAARAAQGPAAGQAIVAINEEAQRRSAALLRANAELDKQRERAVEEWQAKELRAATHHNELLIQDREHAYALEITAGDEAAARELVALEQRYTKERNLEGISLEESLRLAAEYEQRRTDILRESEGKRSAEMARLREQSAAEEVTANERRLDAQRMLGALAETGGDLGKSAAIAALDKEVAQRRAYYDELVADGQIAYEEAERIKTAITEEGARRRSEILKDEVAQVRAFAESALQDLSGRLGSVFGEAVSGSAALDSAKQRQAQAEVNRARAELETAQRAVQAARSEKDKQKALEETTKKQQALTEAERQAGLVAGLSGAERSAAIAKFTQDFLATLASQAAAQAIYETGMALATQGLTWGVPNPASVNHWAAAAVFGSMAAAAGVGAYALGQARGMTRDEKGSLGGSSSGSGSSDVSSSGGSSSAADSSVKRETVYVLYVADPFETPAEAARRAAQRMKLVKDLDMERRG